MLIGEYKHILDDKKRVSLPKSFRNELGNVIVITRGLDNCLFVYTKPEWKKTLEKMEGLSFAQANKRDFKRFFLSGAVEIESDKAGRILISDHHKEFAKLKKNIVFAGIADRVEIWDADMWEKRKKRIEGKVEQMAENLGEIGAL